MDYINAKIQKIYGFGFCLPRGPALSPGLSDAAFLVLSYLDGAWLFVMFEVVWRLFGLLVRACDFPPSI